ncbi:MAG: HAD family hydrolase [Planctomycetes bacterium]|nr:HAD family hydrolase [Planctomycetota bacterium]
MWSGPRNISTAMMRSWENRGDAAVSDEPLYAHYLKVRQDVDHPGREEILATCDTDWRSVVGQLSGDIPEGHTIWYQKHMAHHLLDEICDHGWMSAMRHGFLIRDPARVVTSLVKVMPNATLRDTGLPQQVEIFQRMCDERGALMPVIDAADVLADPQGTLESLCVAFGVPFTERMLRWPAGKRSSDGIWAKYWYATVEKSTGFDADVQSSEPVPERYRGLLEECRPLYEKLAKWRLMARR